MFTLVGMFLYAKLVMQNLMHQVNLAGLRKELSQDTLPEGIDQALVLSPSNQVNAVFGQLVLSSLQLSQDRRPHIQQSASRREGGGNEAPGLDCRSEAPIEVV